MCWLQLASEPFADTTHSDTYSSCSFETKNYWTVFRYLTSSRNTPFFQSQLPYWESNPMFTFRRSAYYPFYYTGIMSGVAAGTYSLIVTFSKPVYTGSRAAIPLLLLADLALTQFLYSITLRFGCQLPFECHTESRNC